MSGPIVRKYGFPNFEKIFGDRGMQHGVEDEKAPQDGPQTDPKPETERADEPGPAKGETKKG